MAATLTEGPVRRRLAELWLPMIGGIVAVKAIGLSDAYFVGQLGDEALAAISFTFPVVMTLISLAIGLSAGASSVLSRAIGDGADDEAQRDIVTGAIAMAVGVAIVLAVAGILSIEYVLWLLGARGDALADATAYMRIWFVGAGFLVLPIAVNGMLRATGDGISPALLMTATAVLNIALNPLLIFGIGPAPELGLRGAAFATIGARGASMVAALALIANRRLLTLSLRHLRAGLARWRDVAIIAGPAALSTSLNPIALSIATAAVATIGDDAVAAFGVATKIQSFAIVPLLALSAASPAFVGQNSGAGLVHRSRRGLLLCAAVSLGWSVAIAAVLFGVGEPLAGLFSDDGNIVALVAIYLAIVPVSYAGYGTTIALSAAMNGLGRSFTALAIGGGRAMLLLAPSAWIGVTVGGFRGLAIGFLTANAIAGALALATILAHPLTARPGGRPCETDPSECD